MQRIEFQDKNGSDSMQNAKKRPVGFTDGREAVGQFTILGLASRRDLRYNVRTKKLEREGLTVIQIIFGKKGSGKTKRILDMANASIQEAKGNVLFVDDGRSYTINLKPQVRFIDASEYAVKGKDSFYGFIAGILAGNYDISYLFVDGFLKLAGSNEAGLVEMMAKLEKLTKDAGTILVLSYSEDAENVPESIRKFAI